MDAILELLQLHVEERMHIERPAFGDHLKQRPNAPEFRQGNTLGSDNRHWFRPRFHQRYRLFYRFSSQAKVIVYAWMSEEGTLRKAGAKTDPYRVFQDLLKAGDPPASFEALFKLAKNMGN